MPQTDVYQRHMTANVQRDAAALVRAIHNLASYQQTADNTGFNIGGFNETDAGTLGQGIDFGRMEALCQWARQVINNNDVPIVHASAVVNVLNMQHQS